MSASEARSWQSSTAEQTTSWQRTAPNKQTKVHVEKRWITPGEKFLYSVFGVLVIISLVYVVHFSSTMDTVNREVQRLEGEIVSQQTKNDNLTYQVKELSNPDRILSIAKENGLKIQNTQVKQTAELVE